MYPSIHSHSLCLFQNMAAGVEFDDKVVNFSNLLNASH